VNIFTAFRTLLRKASPEFKTRLAVMFLVLLLFNLLVWLFAVISIRTFPLLFGLVAISYGLGLRHAVDPDHIAAIDNTTRKLLHDGKKSVSVGFFFSLGHSTIVVLLSLLVIYSTAYLNHNFLALKYYGAIIGTIVSSLFLFIIGSINLVSFIGLYRLFKKIKHNKKLPDAAIYHHLENRGLLTRVVKPFSNAIKNSWNMYPVGLLFGLGFDTASEIALLSITAVTSTKGIPSLLIIFLPFAFTAGMTLIDTIDGILMLGAYGWAYINPERKLYYNLIIVLISVVIAFVIGGMEVLQLIY
jgi:nickel/cobalt transporter (NiCoT) family protein